MLRLRSAASLAAAAMLSCAGLVQAAEPQQSSSGVSLDRPLYLADQKPVDTSLMGLANRTGAGNVLSEAGINIGGHIEGSWTLNFDDPAGGINGGRVFDFENQDPTLNQIMIFVERTVASDKFDVGGRMEWMWGGDARLIHSNGLFDDNGPFDGPDEQFDLTQLYADVNIPIGSGLKVRVGKFVTTIGYEYINPTQNPLFSHSYLFGFAIPFTHTGVVGFYNLNEQTQIHFGMTRGWEQSLEDNNDAHDYLGGIALTLSPETKIYLNASIGPQQTDNSRDYRWLLDFIISHNIGDNLSLALNADWGWEDIEGTGDATWWGVAGYVSYKFNDMFAVNGRVEYFNDDDGARGLGTSVMEFTAGLDIKPLVSQKNFASLRVRPEIRYDLSDDNIFDGGGDDNQFTFGVDVLFSF
jgi:hypothetical protein